MCGLTPAIKLTYANPVTATSVIWIDLRHKQHKRPGAHLKRFFCAYRFPMVGCVGASSDAAVLVPAKVNPAQPATLLLLDLNHGGSSETHKETIMSTPLFVPRGDITPAECHDYIRIYAFQAQALTQLVSNTFSNCRAGEDYSDTQDQLGWALWALNDLLRAQIALCERLEGVGFTTKESPHV